MEFSDTMKQNHVFRRLYSKGRSVATPSLVVYCRGNGRDTNLIGFTVSKKIGNAVCRNRVRRKLREIYRLHESELRRGLDIVVVARVRSAHVSYAELETAFLTACARLKLLEPPAKSGDKA